MNELPKWFLTSRGVMGPLLSVLAIVLGYFNVDFTASEQGAIITQAEAMVVAGTALLGSVLGLIGRIRARSQVTLLPPEQP